MYVETGGGFFHRINVDLSLLLHQSNSLTLQLAWNISPAADIRTGRSEVISLSSMQKHCQKTEYNIQAISCLCITGFSVTVVIYLHDAVIEG